MSESGRGGTLLEIRDSLPVHLLYFVIFFILAVVSVVSWGWGLLGGVLFGGYATWSLARLVDRRPRLVITEDGIIDRTYLHSPGLIRWDDIIDVRPSRWGLIDIELRDEAGYFERLSPYASLAAGKAQLFGHSPAFLQPLGLAISRGRLVDAIEDGMDAHVLASSMAEGELPRGPDPGSEG